MNRTVDRRKQVLTFIRSRIEAEGRPPTLDEIASACGFKSRSGAQKHVRALEASGDLQVTRGKARSARPMQVKSPASVARQMFEVSARDIAELSDESLRALVARLCMARLADAGIPPSPVTWGGDQRAPDGGIDVSVQLTEEDAHEARFSRSATGIQVKATRMPASEIHKEMCPNGILRPSIREIINDKGTYIIATSDSVTDSEYKRRVAAMKAAASTEPDFEDTEFDYYDARRLADWTNRHPGVVAWVRSQLGRPLQGWQPFGYWAGARGGKAQPFIPDEKNRLFPPQDRERAVPLIEGLARVRNALTKGGSSVRLTGLSGVGKTRFAQALFEEAAAPDPLSADLAIYTDTAHSPDPAPLAVLDELLVTRRHAVMIVDNCSSQLHNQLTARCKVSDRISLLTIEYDIREDLPMETEEFQLEAASGELIEKVIEQQFPHISQVNTKTITEFADGNSRVAIALANTMGINDSLAGLTDRELFDRLFWLGKDVQRDLKVAAEACALVYSFDGENTEGELSLLAALAGEPPLSLYRHVNDLMQRGLAQRRGKWRAILPHAVANTLAAQALDAIPYSIIENKLVLGQDRLLRSFSRRLGYLHNSAKAQEIVRRWLSPKGLLGNLAELSPLLLDVLTNVAPVDLAGTLAAIKRALAGAQAAEVLAHSSTSRSRLVRLTRSIAYEKEHFEDCLEILLAFALAEPEDTKTDSTRSIISSLFFLYLSGTHASTTQRVNWVRRTIASADPAVQQIGFVALESALESHHFTSHYGFEFGARVRDYGAYPRGKDALAWFESFIGLAVDVATREGPLSERARDLLARKFRSLWTAGLADIIEPATIPLLDAGWEKGWLAIRQTIRFDRKGMPAELAARLRALEARSRPNSLVARVKAVVLSGHSAGVDFTDGEAPSKAYERADQVARELGELVAGDADALATLLPQLVTNEQGRQWMFGAGLGSKTDSIENCWKEMIQAFESAQEDARNLQVVRGFLNSVHSRNRAAFDEFLDEAMTRDSLVQWVPVLQMSAPLDELACQRLLASMDNPTVPAWVFHNLSFGRATQALPDAQLAELLQRLSIKPDGLSVAIDILYMHIHENPNPIGPKLTEVARSLVANAPFTKGNHRFDHELAGVIKFFLSGPDARAAAAKLLSAVRDGLQSYRISQYEWSNTIGALFKAQPKLALETLVGDEPDKSDVYIRRRSLAGGRRSSALKDISIDELLSWCREGNPQRWAHVAPLVPAFAPGDQKEGTRWSEQVLALLKHAPKPELVAEALLDLIQPTSWSGSRAEAIRHRLPLLDQLVEILGPKYADTCASWRGSAMRAVELEAQRELEEHREENERFE